MLLHASYLLAGDGRDVVSKRVPVADLRLRLPNGEVKVPHGGLMLLCQLECAAEGIKVAGQRVHAVGRAVLKGSPRTGTGAFGFVVRGTPYTLRVAFLRTAPAPERRLARDARAVEFVVTGLAPEHDPQHLLADPDMLGRIDRQILDRREGEFTTDELARLLGGGLELEEVRFDGEGAFRVL